MNFDFFDGHTDIITRVYDFGGDIFSNNYHFSLENLQNHKKVGEVFALCLDRSETSFRRLTKYINFYYDLIEKHKNYMNHIYNFSDIEKSDKLLNTILSIEGLEYLNGKTENFYKAIDLGVRCMNLTWNYTNELGESAKQDTKKGLTKFGFEILKKMNDEGILLDVSHLNEKGFFDVYEKSKKPFAAAHSNCKSLCSHYRNLTDDQIKCLIERNGIMGINFYAHFLEDNYKDASLLSIKKHIDHIYKLGGENIVALGSDLDGYEDLPSGYKNVSDTQKIIDFVYNEYGSENGKKFAYGNFIRFCKNSLRN